MMHTVDSKTDAHTNVWMVIIKPTAKLQKVILVFDVLMPV